jgi:hypothetical protein
VLVRFKMMGNMQILIPSALRYRAGSSTGLTIVAAGPWLRSSGSISRAPRDMLLSGYLLLTSLLWFETVTGGNERTKLFGFHRTSSLSPHGMIPPSACLAQNNRPDCLLTFLNVSISSRLTSYASSSIRLPASLHRMTQLIPTR